MAPTTKQPTRAERAYTEAVDLIADLMSVDRYIGSHSREDIERTARFFLDAPGIGLLFELEEAVEHINCVRVQRDIDRNGSATVGTCLWDEKTERLLDELPANACWPCKARALVQKRKAAMA